MWLRETVGWTVLKIPEEARATAFNIAAMADEDRDRDFWTRNT
jgi:hypothetical protein